MLRDISIICFKNQSGFGAGVIPDRNINGAGSIFIWNKWMRIKL